MELFKHYVPILHFLWEELRVPCTLAGGFVRDSLMDKPIKDADIFFWCNDFDIGGIVKELNNHFALHLSHDNLDGPYQERLNEGTITWIYNSADGVLPRPLQLIGFTPRTADQHILQNHEIGIQTAYAEYVVDKFDLDICKAYALPVDSVQVAIVPTEEFTDAHNSRVLYVPQRNHQLRSPGSLRHYKERIKRIAEKYNDYQLVWEGGEPGEARGPFTSTPVITRQSEDGHAFISQASPSVIQQAYTQLLAGNHVERLEALPRAAISSRYWDTFDELFPANPLPARWSSAVGQEIENSEGSLQLQQDPSGIERANRISSPARREPTLTELTRRRFQSERARSALIEEFRVLNEQTMQRVSASAEREGNS